VGGPEEQEKNASGDIHSVKIGSKPMKKASATGYREWRQKNKIKGKSWQRERKRVFGFPMAFRGSILGSGRGKVIVRPPEQLVIPTA